jgi:hypothetical protein
VLAYEIGLEELLEEDHPFDLGQLPALRYFKIQQEGSLGRNAAVLYRVDCSPSRPLPVASRPWKSILPGTESMLDVEKVCFHLTLGGPH